MIVSVSSVAVSFAAAVLLGVVVAVFVSSIIDIESGLNLEFWGMLNGSVVGLATFAALLAATAGSLVARRGAAMMLSLVLGVAALVGFWFALTYGTPPWTLEGLWMWPTVIGLATGTVLALRWVVRMRGSQSDARMGMSRSRRQQEDGQVER